MLRRLSHIRNCTLAATDGELGKVKDVYFDDYTWRARYIVVDTAAWLTGRRVVIPPSTVTGLDPASGRLSVALTMEQVEQSPGVDGSDGISRRDEEEWHRHFGLSGYWGAPQVNVPVAEEASAPAPRAASAPPEALLWSSSEITDYAVHSLDGDVGRIQDFLIDDAGWQFRYLVVLRSWLAGTETLLAPRQVAGMSLEDMKVYIAVTRDALLNAPVWDGAEPPSPAYEDTLSAHYGAVTA